MYVRIAWEKIDVQLRNVASIRAYYSNRYQRIVRRAGSDYFIATISWMEGVLVLRSYFLLSAPIQYSDTLIVNNNMMSRYDVCNIIRDMNSYENFIFLKVCIFRYAEISPRIFALLRH